MPFGSFNLKSLSRKCLSSISPWATNICFASTLGPFLISLALDRSCSGVWRCSATLLASLHSDLLHRPLSRCHHRDVWRPLCFRQLAHESAQRSQTLIGLYGRHCFQPSTTVGNSRVQQSVYPLYTKGLLTQTLGTGGSLACT